jgi:hypothetical protein
MNTPPSRPRLSRRDALKLLAAAGVTAVGGYALFEYPPWLNYDQQASDIRRPAEQTTTLPAHMREIVRYATLAASGHNTQPWKFAISANAIDIYPDVARHLSAVDPSDRELWISLGCALENLIIAARAAGYVAEVTYPDAADVIHIGLTQAIPQGGALFDALPLRQNTRSAYDGRPTPTADLDQLQSLRREPGVALHVITSPAERETVLEYVNQGNLRQYADPAFVQELIAWVRFNTKEALATLDGLYAPSSGNPAVPRWLGQLVVGGMKPQQQADADAAKLRSSSGVVVVTSASDDKAAWVRTGQVYERLALTMTSLNIRSAFLNQPIEVAAVRGQFQSAMGLATALPQLLVRFGYADALPRSLRRPVEQVLV